MLFEEALAEVGDFGLFQYLLIVYLCIFVAPLRVLPLFAHIFTLLVPPHWCDVSIDSSLNLTEEMVKNLTIPKESDGSYSKCTMYDVNFTEVDWASEYPNSSWPVTTCQFGWKYDFSLIYPTVVSELDWVCHHTWKAYLSNSIFFASMSVGVLIFGSLGDKTGRIPIMIFVYIAAGVGGIMTYFSTNFALFLLTRIIEGLVILSISINPFVLAIEYVPSEKRMLVLTAFRFAYPFIGCCMPWIAYWLGDWRKLYILMIIPCFVAPLVSWFIPESSRWLITKGKEKQTKKILMRIAKVNRKKVDPDIFDSLEFPKKGKAGASPVDMLRRPVLRRNFLITLFLWLIACLTYTAGQLYAATATDNPFLMTSATNGADIIATAVALPLADKWGRRPSMLLTYTTAAVAYLAVTFVPKEMDLLLLIVLMIGRLALTMAYNVGYLYAAEIYPTAVRSQALSIRQAFGSLGKFLSSQITQLAFYGRNIPLVILGILSFVTAMLTYPLPETVNRPLPETLDDGEKMSNANQSCFGCPSNAEPPPVPSSRRSSISAQRKRTMSAVSAATVDSVSPH